jgi:hypothetical protein
MTNEQFNNDLTARHDAELAAGGAIIINHSLPTVSIFLSDNNSFFFQGDEAAELLETVPDFVNEEVFLLAMAQGW